eukprot:TRINITY_DN1039_c0_g1_i1.p1 TRINITY_DN1039_c0_g1~~TRINITY_DN1039_c0_g1_i1.p1  ORF type:complete len:552 (-),score=14.05 TRINITY_DN1039_c0_g1_i1:165-1820(-)
MTSPLFEIPSELRLAIFESFSLRDIGRLRQCCSSWKNNLQDLSFMKVLDFSYSPDISMEAFEYLMQHRINKVRNNITKVIIAHTRNLNNNSLEELFRTLPRLKDIRLRYSLPPDCVPILLKQENLESIAYRYNPQLPNEASFGQLSQIQKDPASVKLGLEIKCTKLTRFKVRLPKNERWAPKLRLKLLEMNPALKNDVWFLKFAVSRLHSSQNRENYAECKKLMDVASSSNDLRLYKTFWNHVDMCDLHDNGYTTRLLIKTIELLRALSEEELKTNITAQLICRIIVDICDSNSEEAIIKIMDEHESWIAPLADLYDREAEQETKSLEKLKKRPFHRDAGEIYLDIKIGALKELLRRQRTDGYEAKLAELVEIMSSCKKKLTPQLKLMRAGVYVRQGKPKEAYEDFLSVIDPRYNFTLASGALYDDKQTQAYFGAYHMAKDYLKSPELLQRLESYNPESYKTLSNHLGLIQESLDAGKCTKTVSQRPYMQCWYACYTCGIVGTFRSVCYACIKTCHANHDVSYLGPSNTSCFCSSSLCESRSLKPLPLFPY